MHIHRPGTDQYLDLTFTINGIVATEYELPSTSSIASSDGYFDTYIAVKLDDRLGLKWTWSGSLLHGQFDFIADGTFVRENRIEGDSQTGAIKFVKKTQKFDTGLDCPTPDGWTSVEPHKDIFEGNLVVADLDKESCIETAGGSRPGVGSLVFVASVNQHTLDQYHDQEKSLEMGSWKKRLGDEVRLAELSPDFCLELRLSSDDKIKSKRSVQHRNRWVQTRFGLQAWGKMCFYYRTAAAIEQAGGVVRDEQKIVEVEAWDDERDFVEVEPVKRAAPRRKDAVSDNEDGDESLFVSTNESPERMIKQENVSDQTATPMPKKKKAKLGGALFGSAEKAHHKDDDAINITGANGEDGEEVFGSQDDIEPTSSELAAAPNDDPLQYHSTDSAEKLDYFDQQQGSEVSASESARINDTVFSPSEWKFPSSPPFRQQKLIEASPPPPSVNADLDPSIDPPRQASDLPTPLIVTAAVRKFNAIENQADFDSEPNMDTFRIPTLIEIEIELDPTGTPRAQIQQLLKNNGPFTDASAAEVIFAQRVASVAVAKSDGKYYPKPEEDSDASTDGAKAIVPRLKAAAKTISPAPKAAAKKASPASKAVASKTTPATKQTAAARTRTRMKPATFPTPTRGEVKQYARPDSSSRNSAPPQLLPAAAPNRTLPTTPSSTTHPTDNKRSRTESSTPGATSGLKARKHYKANLRRELAAKEGRLQKANERARRDEEQIAELERLNRDADERLREMEDDDDDEDEDTEDDAGEEYGIKED